MGVAIGGTAVGAETVSFDAVNAYLAGAGAAAFAGEFIPAAEVTAELLALCATAGLPATSAGMTCCRGASP